MSENDFKGQASTGSGKSEAEVAFELVSKLKGQGVWGERNIGAILDMYAECLDATKGLRAYEGQKRVEVPIHQAGQAAVQPQRVPVQAPAAPRQAAPVQAQPQQAAPQQQPVHAQQQQLQQAFKQG
ncbi:hypothetical protein N9M10_03410 [Hellea sp.]|nr:hypothetical protein [Hellea sp.]